MYDADSSRTSMSKKLDFLRGVSVEYYNHQKRSKDSASVPVFSVEVLVFEITALVKFSSIIQTFGEIW